MIWLTQSVPEMVSPLYQWGPLGIFAALLIYAVNKLFGRVSDSTQATIIAMQATIDAERANRDAERLRADRLEDQLRQLNLSIHETLSSLAASNRQQGRMLESTMKREQL